MSIVIQGDVLPLTGPVIIDSHLLLERVLPLLVDLYLPEELVRVQLLGDQFVLPLVVEVVVSGRQDVAEKCVRTQ